MQAINPRNLPSLEQSPNQRQSISTLKSQPSRDKRLWIYSKLLKKESLNPPTAVKEYVSGEGFFYLGRSYRLKLVDGVNRQPPLRLYQSRFELQREAQARGREEFVRWYCDRLCPILDAQIAAFVNRFGASPRSVQVRELGYRWGSCGHKGDLYFYAPCGDAAASDDRVCGCSRAGASD